MIKFYPSVLNGSLKAPASKSCGLRMMFAASLSAKPVTIENLPECRDIRTAADCLNAMGCKVELKGKDRLTARIEPFAKTVSLQTVDFNFRDSATTARFLTVISSVYGIPANCQAEGTLLKRPQVSMTSRMALRGASFSSFSFPLKMEGRLYGGDFELSGEEGSQFISALIMALPVLRDDSRIILSSPIVDETFISMTTNIMNQFNVHVERTDYGFFIPGQQYYEAPKKLVCENDWGLATMWTAAGSACSLKGGSVTVTDLPAESLQKYRNANSTFPLICQDFRDLNIDASEFPNLATVFAALAAAKGGTIRVSGVPQLKHKETNRLRSIGQCLEQFGVTYVEADDGFILTGKEDADYPEDLAIDTMGDPWVFMSLAIASAAFKNPITLLDEHGADKIYADFLKDFMSLGGRYVISQN